VAIVHDLNNRPIEGATIELRAKLIGLAPFRRQDSEWGFQIVSRFLPSRRLHSLFFAWTVFAAPKSEIVGASRYRASSATSLPSNSLP